MCGKRSKGFACPFRPTYPDFLHGAPPTPTCAAFIKESRMKFANARKPDRKSGVRLGERGAPVQFPVSLFWVEGSGLRTVVSHISRKTSEMPRISCTQPQTEPRVRLSLRKGA